MTLRGEPCPISAGDETVCHQTAFRPREAPNLHEFFAADPAAADDAFFGRRSFPDRRGFLRSAGLAAMTAMVGATIPFHRNMPAGLVPVVLANENVLAGKDGLTLLNDRPINAETPPQSAG